VKMLELNRIYNCDCLEGMKKIDDKSIDMILCDLPYGTTACKWDSIIPFEPLWEQYNRIIKDNGAIVLFGTEPFSSKLRMSNIKNYKYDWVWNKRYAANYPLAKKQPMKIHENICVFNSKRYYPIMEDRNIPIKKGANKGAKIFNSGLDKSCYQGKVYTQKYPESILFFPTRQEKKKYHPTQKPVALCEYLIRTYTNEGDLVLDNCAGSGTTGVACINTGRNYILMEKEPKYCEIAEQRIAEAKENHQNEQLHLAGA
jgi:site-specific DNA-methyltransferase (adenine-specific)